MKKKVTLLLTVLIMLMAVPGLYLTAFAEDELSYYNVQEYGFNIDLNEISGQSDYCLMPIEYGVLGQDPFVSVLGVRYFALSEDTVKAINTSFYDMSEEEQNKISQIIVNMAADITYIIVSNAQDENDAMEAAGISNNEDMEISEIGSVNGFHFYFLSMFPEEYLDRYAYNTENEEFVKALEEIEDSLASGVADFEKTTIEGKDKVREDLEMTRSELLKKLRETELFAPSNSSDEYVGQVIQFETTDLDGNTVKSEDLFKDNKITMVNVWGTWCSYCVEEMAELAEIHTRLQEKGCGIIGVEDEGEPITDDLVDQAKKLMEEKGTHYPNVIMPEGDPIFSALSGWPTSFFVDSEGKILTYPIVGSNISAYESTIDKLLAEE